MATLLVRTFGALQDYRAVWQSMQDFTAARTAKTPDELWLLEHTPVYTQGQAGKPEHVLHAGDNPVIRTDRGGQVTWHGPGQLMLYTLLDTKRLQLGPRALVTLLEQVVIETLAVLGIAARARHEAPGVYVQRPDGCEAKIAALGLRFRQQGCYHGIAFNIDADLAAFAGINPCGHAGMAVTRLADLLPVLPARDELESLLIDNFAQALHYTDIQRIPVHD